MFCCCDSLNGMAYYITLVHKCSKCTIVGHQSRTTQIMLATIGRLFTLVCLWHPFASAVSPLGTITSKGTVQCAAGSPTNVCTGFTVTCPGVPDIDGQFFFHPAGASPSPPAPSPSPSPSPPGPRPSAQCVAAMEHVCPGERGKGAACRNCLHEHRPLT